MVGDSMTEYLGNSDEIRANLKKYYPDKSVEVLNYGFGSTNILSLQERLEKKTFFNREFRPILDIDFDLILIESFGNNPLSQFPLSEGLQKQNEALDKIVESIKSGNPRAKIAFVATIAPKNGDGNLIYLNAADYIHPSPSGVVFISQIIADSIFQQKIF